MCKQASPTSLPRLFLGGGGSIYWFYWSNLLALGALWDSAPESGLSPRLVSHGLVSHCFCSCFPGGAPKDGSFAPAQHSAGQVRVPPCQGGGVQGSSALWGVWNAINGHQPSWLLRALREEVAASPWDRQALGDPAQPRATLPCPGTCLILLFSTMTSGTDPSQDGDDTFSRKSCSRISLGAGDLPLQDSDPSAMGTGWPGLLRGPRAVRTPILPPTSPSWLQRLGTSCCDYFGGGCGVAGLGPWRSEGRSGGWSSPIPVYNPLPPPCLGPDLILELSGFSRGDGFPSVRGIK